MNPVAVLIHVPDINEGLEWYQKAFPEASSVYYPESDFTVLKLSNISLEIVQADEKVSAGKKGTVVYWFAENWAERLSSLEALGAKLYRGPMVIEHGQIMCQFEDPFGNLIGLRGKVT